MPVPPVYMLDDEAAITTDLAALSLGPVPRQKPWLTLSVASAVAILVGAGLLLKALLAPFDPQRTPLGAALGEGIASYVVALGRPPGVRAEALASAKARASSRSG